MAERKSHTWALDVTDNAARGIVHELNANLGDTTTGAYTVAKNKGSAFIPLHPYIQHAGDLRCGENCESTKRTGTAEDTGDLDELSGLLAGIHLEDRA